jgi:hypothetical protein
VFRLARDERCLGQLSGAGGGHDRGRARGRSAPAAHGARAPCP